MPSRASSAAGKYLSVWPPWFNDVFTITGVSAGIVRSARTTGSARNASIRCSDGLEMSVTRSLIVRMPRAASAASSSARRAGKPAVTDTLMWNRKCVAPAGMAASTASTLSSKRASSGVAAGKRRAARKPRQAIH